MSLLEDPFYGAAIQEWVETHGGCEECKTAIKARAGEIQHGTCPSSNAFDMWYSGAKEFILPNSAAVQKCLECLRSSSDEMKGTECVAYLLAAAGFHRGDAVDSKDLDFLQRAIVEIVLARVAPNIPDRNFFFTYPHDRHRNRGNRPEWNRVPTEYTNMDRIRRKGRSHKLSEMVKMALANTFQVHPSLGEGLCLQGILKLEQRLFLAD